MILQHGGGQTRHAWKGTGETLGAAGYHAIAFDARGHGDSDWAPDGLYTQEAMVADLICVLAALGDRRPVLVGASMGGGTSLVAVGEDHVDGSALVLVDIAPRIEPEGVSKIKAFMSQKPDGFDSLEEVAVAIASYQPHRERPRNLDGLAKNVRLGDDGKYHWHWDPKSRMGETKLEQRELRLEECAAQPQSADAPGSGRSVGHSHRGGGAAFSRTVSPQRVCQCDRRRSHGGGRPQRHLRQRGHRFPQPDRARRQSPRATAPPASTPSGRSPRRDRRHPVTDRLLPLVGAYNFRDLGHYPTIDGRVTVWGKLFRSDTLHELTTADLEVLRQIGLAGVIDLRTTAEVERAGRGLLADEPIRYLHASVLQEEGGETVAAPTGDDPSERYLWYLDAGRLALVAALEMVADPDSYPLVFHCAAGKDRTGVLAALVLDILGVHPDVIIEDYMLTATRIDMIRASAPP